MLYGVRPGDNAGSPTGANRIAFMCRMARWYGYLMRRMAERPTNASLWTPALISRNWDPPAMTIAIFGAG